MKGMTLLGIVLLALSAFLFYLTSDFTVQEISISHMMGIMAGIGIGLIIGGVIGYISKGSAIKEEARRKEFKRLQKENGIENYDSFFLFKTNDELEDFYNNWTLISEKKVNFFE